MKFDHKIRKIIFITLLTLVSLFLEAQSDEAPPLGEDVFHNRHWIMENERYAPGENRILLTLFGDRTARLTYLFYFDDPEKRSWRTRMEEWYPITGGRIIVQDYMGEFIVLKPESDGSVLLLDSPVAGFSGLFSEISQIEWEEKYSLLF